MPAVLSMGALEQAASSVAMVVSIAAQTTDNFSRSILGTFLNQTVGIISAHSAEAEADEASDLAGEAEFRSFTLDMSAHGERLDRALALSVQEFSRSYLQQLIESGLVQVNGKQVTKTSGKVKVGDSITVELKPTPQSQAFKPESMALDVVFEDEHVLVINKPPGLVVHPAPGNWSGTLLNGLLGYSAHAAQVPRAGIVHRLDKDTSGLMVVARTRSAMDALVRAIAARDVSRQYFAIAHKTWPWTQPKTVDAPIGRDPRNRLRMAVVDLVHQSGKEARTDMELLGNSQVACWVRCILHTGRTHQIRVHMASIGHPLVSDLVYGGAALAGMQRQALHACRLAFAHPVTGKALLFESAPPADFMALSSALGLSYNPASKPGGL
jgi:23S rRNA pseudouridine1911/1915/1917 synthase